MLNRATVFYSVLLLDQPLLTASLFPAPEKALNLRLKHQSKGGELTKRLGKRFMKAVQHMRRRSCDVTGKEMSVRSAGEGR